MSNKEEIWGEREALSNFCTRVLFGCAVKTKLFCLDWIWIQYGYKTLLFYLILRQKLDFKVAPCLQLQGSKYSVSVIVNGQ